jgi:hypothetical protein
MQLGENARGGGDEYRDLARTNMFIAAMLHAGGGAAPVKIRNMSPEGALAEAPHLPGAGSIIDLVRGKLCASGEVVWQAGSRCGLRFDRAIVVKDWMSLGHTAQSALERSVVKFRSGLSQDEALAEDIAGGIGAEVGRLAALLDRLGEGLSGDPRVLADHGETLQALDLAAQLSAALRNAVDSDLAISCEGRARLRALRPSCIAALAPAAP